MGHAALAVALGALLLAGPAEAKQHRSAAAKHQFMAGHPCPGGPDQGSIARCRGFVVDHRTALACGGPDTPENMQYQTLAEGRAKDRWERIGCGK